MKKLISLLIGCSLALAGAALAQQPDEQQSTSKKGKRAPEKAQTTQAQPGANAAKPQQKPANQPGAMKQNQPGAMKQRGAMNEPSATSAGTEKGRKPQMGREPATGPKTNVATKPTSEMTTEPGAGKNQKGRARGEATNTLRPAEKQQAEQQRKGMKAPATAQSAEKQQAEQQRKGMKAPATAQSAEKQEAEQQRKGMKAPATAAGQQNAQATGQQNAQARGTGVAKKPAPQQVQQVKSQHANFRAQPKPQQVPAVTFNQNRRIEGSDRWQGQQYEVFRSYHPEWHDAGWYTSHYARVELIGGGYYFFNNGYWFPAWGYNPSAQYYAYDGPIYVGHTAEPPDKVIADTQALLQQMGYYKGDVDGLLGPLTREALTAYQSDQGLATTASIDQPTLDSL